MQQRAWQGLTATLVATRPGLVSLTATDHVVGLHAGRPVQARCRLDGRAQQRVHSRGDVVLVPSGASGAWDDDRSSRLLLLSVSAALVHKAADGLGLDGASVELTPHLQVRDPQIQHIGWALEAELAGSSSDSLYGDTLAMALAVHLVRRYRASNVAVETPARGLTAAQLGRVVARINDALTDTLTLDELAVVAGVSVSHFQVLFRRSTGQPVHRYIVQQRTEHARALLRDGVSISDAALRSGFCDASHLARWMRRLHGVTPAAMRS